MIIFSFQKRKRKFISNLQKLVIDHFTTGFPLLSKEEFAVGELRYNYKCFFNAVHGAKTEGLSVHLVFCNDPKEDELYLHVINKTDLKFQDNTLGYRYEAIDYYYIRQILPSEFDNVWIFFEEYRKSLIRLLGGEKGMIKYKLASNEIF